MLHRSEVNIFYIHGLVSGKLLYSTFSTLQGLTAVESQDKNPPVKTDRE